LIILAFEKLVHSTYPDLNLNGQNMMKFLFRSNLFSPKHLKSLLIIVVIYFVAGINLNAQNHSTNFNSILTPADTFNSTRFYSIAGIGTGAYLISSAGLYNAWYKNYAQTGFHTFNDWGEWEFQDKLGHFTTAWFNGYLIHSMMRWTGLNQKKSLLAGIIVPTVFLTTIEIMDGFSEKWGFSTTDIGANLLGVSAFALQQYYWNEQKILFKFSTFPTRIDPEIQVMGAGGTTTLKKRYDDLYGKDFLARLLKDYNGQTTWVSFSLKSITGGLNIPDWLNIAVGYSGENIFGGFDNSWVDNNIKYEITDPSLQRYHQFLISPDINWEKINTNSPFLKSLFKLINIVKIPAPAIELNDLEGIRFHLYWLYF
jgi:hypothetical protein